MRFRKQARLDTSQIEDVRRGGVRLPSGRSGRIAAGGGGLSLIGLVVALVVILAGGGNLGALQGLDDQIVGSPAADNTQLERECRTGEDANTQEDCRIVAVVNSVQEFWTGEFERRGMQYQPATTQFFSGSTSTGCGSASSAVGPFYCPVDQKVYIDLEFFEALREELGAKGGPFAQAYVLAHEYGHHVQNLFGVLERARGDNQGPQSQAVRVELQADCYAGVWAARAVQTGFVEQLTAADVVDGLDAAASVGDDRIQERTQGQVNPETWTHGSAAQRQRWFSTGYDTGATDACDTFAAQL